MDASSHLPIFPSSHLPSSINPLPSPPMPPQVPYNSDELYELDRQRHQAEEQQLLNGCVNFAIYAFLILLSVVSILIYCKCS